jgi:hypothetical protein
LERSDLLGLERDEGLALGLERDEGLLRPELVIVTARRAIAHRLHRLHLALVLAVAVPTGRILRIAPGIPASTGLARRGAIPVLADLG